MLNSLFVKEAYRQHQDKTHRRRASRKNFEKSAILLLSGDANKVVRVTSGVTRILTNFCFGFNSETSKE